MSLAELSTRFQNLPLRIPTKYHDLVERYTQTRKSHEGDTRGGDDRPFERFVDLWWAALCLGVREGRRTSEVEAGGWHKFIDANQILPSDPWRAEHLMLLAVAQTKSTQILDQPAQIMEMANEFAATGISILTEAMASQGVAIYGATKVLEEHSSKIEAPQFG